MHLTKLQVAYYYYCF